MAETAQIELLPAAQVARETAVKESPNGIFYAMLAEANVPEADLQHIVQATPRSIASALTRRAYYFVPLTIHEHEEGEIPEDAQAGGETLIAPQYSAELSDRAVCHRNVHFAGADCVFISTRLMQDKFALAFEFFINVAHHFVEATGVPREFATLAWSQACSEVRGETSLEAWESRSEALGAAANAETSRGSGGTTPAKRGRGEEHLRAAGARPGECEAVDEKAKTAYLQAAFSDSVAMYMLALTLDFDYMDLREREYPLLAAPALAERLRHVAGLFPPNPGYEFQILYRRR
jgi:hypothetical protein